MPLAPKRACKPGCPNDAATCTTHKQTYRDIKTPDERKFYSSYRWTEVSKRHRAHEPLCRNCAEQGIVRVGQLTDHIVPVSEGGRRFDESNFQTLCQPCHNAKRQQEKNRTLCATGYTMAEVIVVSGLPGSGKTTYVNDHKSRGDLIVDFDAIYSALSGLSFHDKPDNLMPFVASARDAIYDRLQCPVKSKMKAWIITADSEQATLLTQRFKAQRIDLNVDESERQRRVGVRLNAGVSH